VLYDIVTVVGLLVGHVGMATRFVLTMMLLVCCYFCHTCLHIPHPHSLHTLTHHTSSHHTQTDGFTALYLAAQEDNASICQELLEAGADPLLVGGPQQLSPLHIAAHRYCVVCSLL